MHCGLHTLQTSSLPKRAFNGINEKRNLFPVIALKRDKRVILGLIPIPCLFSSGDHVHELSDIPL